MCIQGQEVVPNVCSPLTYILSLYGGMKTLVVEAWISDLELKEDAYLSQHIRNTFAH